ncbi:hypothetical protein UFOVP410_169 [uncultured Caudovirales phage]|uniref:Uncharacterized protein n=1 Tax=uncultured Caudovirales phage TaxID=2100421 RepID=A0A6J5M870_9CAUD|nr:hypothetical protein UFOVP410_169 [uncultured Caudovirales phage]
MSKYNLEEYKNTVKNMSDEDLHKEIWMLDIHIQYLQSTKESSVDDVVSLFNAAKDEREQRIMHNQYR